MINKKNLKNKINIIKYAFKITKSIETISISKLKNLEIKLNNNNLYNNFFLKIINNINNINYNNYYFNNILKFDKILYLVIFTDQGLCGNLNINLFNKIKYDIFNKNYIKKKIYIFLLGNKSNYLTKYFINLNLNIKIINYNISNEILLNNNTKIIYIVKKIINFYKLNKSKIYIVFNILKKFKNIILINKLLPIRLIKKYNNINYIYENINYINIKNIIYKYIESIIFNSILNNLISENFFRIIIMKNASKNSENLFNNLNIIYNKIRQFNITKEIIELVSNLDIL